MLNLFWLIGVGLGLGWVERREFRCGLGVILEGYCSWFKVYGCSVSILGCLLREKFGWIVL